MKSRSLLTLMCLVVFSSIWAQPGPPRGGSQRMEALRIAFMTERLSLTPEESKSFWPLHESFEAQMEAQREAMNTQKDAFDATGASSAELRDLVERLAQQRKDMVDLESVYLLEIADLLGTERALMLPDMQRELARTIRERMGGSGRKGPPGARQSQSPRSARRQRLN